MTTNKRGQGGDICAAAEHREDEANARADKAEALAAELADAVAAHFQGSISPKLAAHAMHQALAKYQEATKPTL